MCCWRGAGPYLGDIPCALAYDRFVIDVTEIYYFVFGALTFIGGIIGYVKAKSWVSLIAGTLCGLILIGAGVLLSKASINPALVKPGLILGILVSVALAGQFVPKVILNRAPVHAIVMAVLSAGALVLTLISFLKK